MAEGSFTIISSWSGEPHGDGPHCWNICSHNTQYWENYEQLQPRQGRDSNRQLSDRRHNKSNDMKCGAGDTDDTDDTVTGPQVTTVRLLF